VGSGVLGSAIGMDKDVMKRLLRDSNIPIADFFYLFTSSNRDYRF
jgi:D-alanine-D-alanine ligase